MDAESYWAGYLAARFERFGVEKKALIGAEYNSNATYWNDIILQEWNIMKSRLQTGFDISETIKTELGLDFFQPNLDEIRQTEVAQFTLPSGVVSSHQIAFQSP